MMIGSSVTEIYIKTALVGGIMIGMLSSWLGYKWGLWGRK